MKAPKKELHLQNQQRVRPLHRDRLRAAAAFLLDDLLGLASYSLAIHFVSSRRMAFINQQFLGHEGSTDVITFDLREGYGSLEIEAPSLAGEIFISVADAIAQAEEFGTSWQEEILRYIIHGVLHLQGFDDLAPAPRKLMKQRENRLLRTLARAFPPRTLAP